ncbi:SitI3 family protein [Actinoplanes sp. NPDC048796]|uniref:SitI3 family protein n=1 Tax=Actinoplanes sp. NPDC048796 TaxID=3155640 RepID=UPI0033F01495
MALEYDWSGDARIDTPTLRSFLATALAGELHADGTLFRDGMYVTARAVSGDNVNPAIALFGWKERFSATFRFANQATEETTEHNHALMAHALIAFAQRHGGNGVLLYNGDEAVLQYGEGGIVFSSDWDDWAENSETAPLLAQFPMAVLPQPLL